MASKLPKAGTIQNRDPSEERKKIVQVKHKPKADEEILDELITKHTAKAVTVRKAEKDAKSELALIKKGWQARD